MQRWTPETYHLAGIRRGTVTSIHTLSGTTSDALNAIGSYRPFPFWMSVISRVSWLVAVSPCKILAGNRPPNGVKRSS
jgi:hypothetical protein